MGQDVSNESLQWKRQHELHYTANNSRVSCSFICYLFSFLRIFVMLQLWGLYSNLRSWHIYFLNKNTMFVMPTLFSLSQLCNYWISEKSLIFILQSIRVIRSDLSRMCPTVRISSLSDGTDSLFLFWSFYPTGPFWSFRRIFDRVKCQFWIFMQNSCLSFTRDHF